MLCALCQKGHTRELSHIIPKMVYRWLRDVSVTGHLRWTSTPNRRSQDGPKRKLLCPTCEDFFSRFETEFARKLFNPIHRAEVKQLQFDYGEWFLKFSVSVSWRCLLELIAREPDSPWPFNQEEDVQNALESWRKFLIGESSELGVFQQHVVILDQVVDAKGILHEPDLNIYFLRSVDFNTIHSPTETYIFSKLGRVVLVGTIFHAVEPFNWQGTLIHPNEGKFIYPIDHGVSSCLFNFFESSIADMKRSRKVISENQVRKMNESFFKRHGFWPWPSAE